MNAMLYGTMFSCSRSIFRQIIHMVPYLPIKHQDIYVIITLEFEWMRPDTSNWNSEFKGQTSTLHDRLRTAKK